MDTTKRTDYITQMILDFNRNEGEANIHGSVELYITEWKESFDDKTEQEMVQELSGSFQDGWNNYNPRARHFLTTHKMDLEIVEAIEDLYDYWKDEFGDDLNKTKLVDKLDLIYYFEAEEEFRKEIENEDLDLEYWG